MRRSGAQAEVVDDELAFMRGIDTGLQKRGTTSAFFGAMLWRFVLLGGLLLPYAAQAQSGESSLRDLADSRGKLFGTAVNGRLIDPDGSAPQVLRDILATEFNVYVAESRYKMAYVLPNAPADPFNVQISDLNTDSIDGLVALARANGVQRIRGHVLIWHQGMPSWLSSASSGWNAQQITDFATSYITAVLTYCRENVPEIYEWDVINETIDAGSGAFRTGTWYDAANRQNFIDALFHAARAADPNVRLVYNDYGIEYAGNSKTTFMLNMVSGMVSRGVPIDGVGLQCHFAGPNASGNGGFTTTSATSFRNVFVQLANLGLDCIVTELDLRLKTDSATTEGNVTAQQLDEQGVQYERIVATALSQPNCPAVLTWGFSDTASWIPSYFSGYGHALLYDRDHQRKPAYFGVADALASLPVTNTPPAVESRSVRTLKDQPKSITLSGTDAQDDALTYSVVDGPTNGVLDDTALPDIIYTPNPDYVGTDSFTFKANDGVFGSAPGTISITIVASNIAPTANAGTDQSVTLSTSVPWSPANLSPAAWYDAADSGTITASSGAVSQWSDKSGKGNHVTQGTSTARPTTGTRTLNGLNVMNFDGSNDELLDPTFASLSSLNLSIFAVQQHDRLELQSMTAWGLGRNTIEDGLIMHSSYDNSFAFGYRHPENKPVYYTENTNAELLSYVKSGPSSQQAWVDGLSKGVQSGTVTTFTTQRLALGSRFSANYLDGGIGEFIVVPSAVSEEDRQKLEGYLAHKWGLAANLPGGHPYESAAPEVSGAVVSLSDASVTDADGDTLSHIWTVVSAPAGATAVFDDESLVNATVTFDTVGAYVLRLTADDGIETDFDEILISVTGEVTADAGPDQTVVDTDNNGSEDVTLDGSSSSGGGGGSITSYVWNDGTSDIATGVAPTVTLAVGTHTITLTVTDDDGATDTDTVTITVSGPNTPPAVNAGTDQTVMMTGTSASVFVQDGGAQGLISVESEHFHRNTAGGSDQWVVLSETSASNGQSMDTNLDDGTNTDPAPQLSFDVLFSEAGTHYIWVRGRAYPRSGNEGNADSVHAGLNGALVTSTTAITGFGLSYGWSNALMAGGVASIDVPSTGIHSVEIFMREDGFLCDKMVLTTDSTFTPSANGPAESDVQSIGGATAVLDGASVTDADGDTLSHIWTVVSAPAGATAVFDDESLVNATATFDTAGAYVLRLTADDGIETVFDELRITVTDTSNTLANWIGAYELGGLTGMGDDYDGDGLANGIENYFGTDPSQANPGLTDTAVHTVDAATTFTFVHPLNDNPASDISARYRWSKDLATFHEDGATDSEGTTVHFSQSAPVDGRVTVTATIEGTASDRVFVQLVVTQN